MEQITIYKGVKIVALSAYYSKTQNPATHSNDEHSKNIIKFKSGDPDAVNYFASILIPLLHGSSLKQSNFYIATVPSSTQGKAHPGFTQLIKLLSAEFRIENPNSNILKRTESKTPAHLGGSRSKTDLLNTMGLSTELSKKISGKSVLLLDDVTTTTNSLKAGIDLLINAKAHVIVAIALGKTQH
jgi:predicted amidophosphoribosyltransferase